MSLSDPKRVAEQYQNLSNPNARITLHRKSTVGRRPRHEPVFDRLNLPDGSNLPEVGCGPGNLWTSNRHGIPENTQMTLTDAFGGILFAARSCLNVNLSSTVQPNFTFTSADAEGLPFEDAAFDAVVANHVLYRVPDRAKALSEAARVPKPGGALYVATNGEGHLRELAPHARRLDPDYEPAILGFDLQNGAEQLSPPPFRVSLLTVRTAPRKLPEEELRRRVGDPSRSAEAELEREGETFVRKDAGLFVAEL